MSNKPGMTPFCVMGIPPTGTMVVVNSDTGGQRHWVTPLPTWLQLHIGMHAYAIASLTFRFNSQTPFVMPELGS